MHLDKKKPEEKKPEEKKPEAKRESVASKNDAASFKEKPKDQVKQFLFHFLNEIHF